MRRNTDRVKEGKKRQTLQGRNKWTTTEPQARARICRLKFGAMSSELIDLISRSDQYSL